MEPMEPHAGPLNMGQEGDCVRREIGMKSTVCVFARRDALSLRASCFEQRG